MPDYPIVNKADKEATLKNFKDSHKEHIVLQQCGSGLKPQQPPWISPVLASLECRSTTLSPYNQNQRQTQYCLPAKKKQITSMSRDNLPSSFQILAAWLHHLLITYKTLFLHPSLRG